MTNSIYNELILVFRRRLRNSSISSDGELMGRMMESDICRNNSTTKNKIEIIAFNQRGRFVARLINNIQTNHFCTSNCSVNLRIFAVISGEGVGSDAEQKSLCKSFNSIRMVNPKHSTVFLIFSEVISQESRFKAFNLECYHRVQDGTASILLLSNKQQHSMLRFNRIFSEILIK